MRRRRLCRGSCRQKHIVISVRIRENAIPLDLGKQTLTGVGVKSGEAGFQSPIS